MSIEEVIKLKKEGSLNQARELVIKLLENDKNNSKLLLQAGLLHDQLGYTPQAITYYKQALDSGLDNDNRKKALLCLGSSYRAVGLYEEAKETLEIGMSEYPHDNAFYIFFAMTLYNLDETDLAMEIILTKLLETTKDQSILDYKQALQFYASRLDEVFN
ncbi:tetratricopeptide repeat protein [Bacillaceae bacterium W0354]